MTVLQPRLAAHPHRNQRLFSDHYLDRLLPETGDWRVGVARAADAMGRVRAVYQAFEPSENDAQTEAGLIRPVLELLGHTFEVQPALRTPDGTKRPDYVLYRDAAARTANRNVTLTDAALAGALGVADAKYWDRPLECVGVWVCGCVGESWSVGSGGRVSG